MEKKNSKEIFQRYQSGTASEAEKQWLENWVMKGMEDDFDLTPYELLDDLNAIREKVALIQPTKKNNHLWFRTRIAASIVLLLSVGAYFFFHQQTPVPPLVAQKAKAIIVPGGNNAVLTLADGANISLTETANGQIARQVGASISKTEDGQLVYTASGTKSNSATAYNSITTPKGGKYALTLPDGTKVWLNAASSLKFPTSFNGKERAVQLSGEAYFEVAKSKKMPFLVHSANATITVLGTHFNVMAYEDELNLKTTLIEGSVRLSSKNNHTVLTPGQQGTLSYDGGKIAVANVKTSDVVAWKAGYFIFKDSDLKDVMHQISRWYDVEVTYEFNPGNVTFGGIYSKDNDINELLKGLELTNLVHFKIEGRRIVVTR